MRRRNQYPPPPASADSEGLKAAQAIASAINQGLPGNQFANLVNVMNQATVKQAAAYSLAEVIAWFQQDPAAATILKACPSFERFAQDFHARARELYPPPAGGPTATPQPGA